MGRRQGAPDTVRRGVTDRVAALEGAARLAVGTATSLVGAAVVALATTAPAAVALDLQ